MSFVSAAVDRCLCHYPRPCGSDRSSQANGGMGWRVDFFRASVVTGLSGALRRLR